MNPNESNTSGNNSIPATGMTWVALGAVLGGLSVILGAFGAHSLKAQLTEQKLAVFQTATQYLGYHGLAILLVGMLTLQLGDAGRALKKVAILFSTGIILFSGSLYALTFGGPRFFGPITPLGGLCFIVGWFILAGTVIKIKKSMKGETSK